jgi:transposase
MTFAGIDVASRTHVLAIVDESCQTIVPPTEFTEDASGYAKAQAILSAHAPQLIALEATGHYSYNLFLTLHQWGHTVARLNPLRTFRFTQENLVRGRTDRVDALSIACFAAQKRPRPTPPLSAAYQRLHEYAHWHERLLQDCGDRRRQLHRLVQMVFPELLHLLRHIESQRAIMTLRAFPSARCFKEDSFARLMSFKHNNRRCFSIQLAHQIVAAAQTSIAQHHGDAYQLEVEHICDDLDTLQQRLDQIQQIIAAAMADDPLGRLLMTIPCLGALTVARILGTAGDPAHFASAAAFASYVGVPGTHQSGLSRPTRAKLSPIGHARLRHFLWMTTIVSIRFNPWLRAFYLRLRARDKPAKVAITACMRKLLTAVYSVAKHQIPFIARPG